MWANSARSPKIFFISANAFIPFFVFAVHWSFETFLIGLIGVIFFASLEYYGYTPSAFIKIVKLYLGDNRRKVGRSSIFHRLNH